MHYDADSDIWHHGVDVHVWRAVFLSAFLSGACAIAEAAVLLVIVASAARVRERPGAVMTWTAHGSRQDKQQVARPFTLFNSRFMQTCLPCAIVRVALGACTDLPRMHGSRARGT